MLTDKPDEPSDLGSEDNTFSSADSLLPSFSTTDSLVSNFNSVASLTMEGLSSDEQYTIENLTQNIGCDNLDQSMNSVGNTSNSTDDGNSANSTESQSKGNMSKCELTNKSENSSTHLQIDALQSDNQSESSSQITPLEINSLSNDMSGIIQIPYSSVNGLQIIPISGSGTLSGIGGLQYPVHIGQITADDHSVMTFSQDGAVSDMQIDSSQTIGDMQIAFTGDEADSSQLEQYSIKLEEKVGGESDHVQSSQISSELSQEEMESAIHEQLIQGIYICTGVKE